MAVPASDTALYAEYRHGVETRDLAQALRTAVLLVFALQTFVFIPADWILYPDHFERFLLARLTLNALLALIYFRTSRTWPLASTMATCFAAGAMFLDMVASTGGAESGYYVGMILLLVGLGVLVPLNGRQASWIVVTLFATYAGLIPLIDDPLNRVAYGQHLIFLGAAAIEGAMCCVVLDHLRFADFRQRRELEQAHDELRELDQAKSRFSANVHHELRTPLTLMLAPLDALRAGDFGHVPPAFDAMFRTMQSNGRRLLKLINNLLDLARLESGQLGIERQPLDLGVLAAEVVEGAQLLAERKQVQLSLEVADVLPAVNADPDALDKILVNLVGNALKFTDAGGRIGVSLEGSGSDVHLRVSDTGIGLPADQIDRIFDRFAQVDGSATRHHEGTGIGLSLARELVELHGGRIWAESDGPGRGTCLHVIVPPGEVDVASPGEVLRTPEGGSLDLADALESVGEALDPMGAGAAAARGLEMERSVERWEGRQGEGEGEAGLPAHGPDTPEILIAEDNHDMRRLLAFLLSREFRVRAARNGREALEALRESQPDLVLTDVMMPELSGTDLCRAIKSNPETSGLPVVLVTSKAEREMKIEGLELGADDYVTKPFHPRELLARVRSLVRLRRLQAEADARNAALEQALADIQQAEAQLVQSERLAAVGELAAGIAHEVNNPVNYALNAARTLLTTVRSLAGLLVRLAELDADDAKLSERVREIEALQAQLGAAEMAETVGELGTIVKEGLERTSKLVADLRDFARPGAGVFAPVDLGKGLESTLHLLSYELGRAGASAALAIEPGLPTIRGDAGALNQVFLNLLKNAAEAFAGAGGSIEVTASVKDGAVCVVIRDDGPGIPPDLQERLFEPFFTTKEAGRGTGLGLSMSRKIVAAHGGDLAVESVEGRGAIFTLTLPIAQPEEQHLAT